MQSMQWAREVLLITIRNLRLALVQAQSQFLIFDYDFD